MTDGKKDDWLAGPASFPSMVGSALLGLPVVPFTKECRPLPLPPAGAPRALLCYSTSRASSVAWKIPHAMLQRRKLAEILLLSFCRP